MFMLRLCALLALCSQLYACGAPISCTLEFTPSVRIQVVDAQGNPLRNARVTYRKDGGPEMEAMCQGPMATDCDEWWTGVDAPGEFVVKATSADGTRSAERRVTVQGDECHARSEVVQLTL